VVSTPVGERKVMTLPLRPERGGFVRSFGCGQFVREFLSGHGPNDSPIIDPDSSLSLLKLHKQPPDLKDESGGNPGNHSGVESSKARPLPGVGLALDDPESRDAGHIEQAEDHKSKGNK
jgi:hypothetical protein